MPKSGVEYATDQITVYRIPCPYHCQYCWAWRIPLYMHRIQAGRYDPYKEALRYKRMKRPRVIVVSFSSDPYPPVEKNKRKTRKVLEALRDTKHTVMILTKNPILAWDLDSDIIVGSRSFVLGSTVVSLDKNRFEPNAPDPRDRLGILKKAKLEGVRTWLSVEPIIPDVTFPDKIVEETADFIDFYVLGALSHINMLGLPYNHEDLRIWYELYIPRAIDILREYGVKFWLKDNLFRYIPEDYKKLRKHISSIIKP